MININRKFRFVFSESPLQLVHPSRRLSHDGLLPTIASNPTDFILAGRQSNSKEPLSVDTVLHLLLPTSVQLQAARLPVALEL